MYGGGAVIGLSIGGTIIQHYSWHATFFIIIPIAIALLFLIRRYIPSDKEEVERTRILQQHERQIQHHQQDRISATSHKNIDIKGAIILAVTVTSFLLVLTYLDAGTGGSDKNSSIDSSSTMLAASFTVIGIISLALFILVEKDQHHH